MGSHFPWDASWDFYPGEPRQGLSGTARAEQAKMFSELSLLREDTVWRTPNLVGDTGPYSSEQKFDVPYGPLGRAYSSRRCKQYETL